MNAQGRIRGGLFFYKPRRMPKKTYFCTKTIRMRRRTFSQRLLAGAAALAAPALAGAANTSAQARKRIKPPALKKGDTVGLIAPASSLTDEGIQRAYTNLESMGLVVKPGRYLAEVNGFLAGTDEQRLADLHDMAADPQVKAIWCARGGYGITRLLPSIDYRLFRRNPKIIIGYSDVTALLNAVHTQTGIATFHGPVAAAEWPAYTRDRLAEVIIEGRNPTLLLPAPGNLLYPDSHYKMQVIRSGRVSGRLVGGNLTLLQALVGTPYAPDVRGKILFIEDVGEKPYRIDRMLTHLRQVWPIHQAAGIALGIFADCQPGPDDRSATLLETLTERLADLGPPVLYGLSFGHIAEQFTLPMGVEASLDTESGILGLLESGVSHS